MSKAEMTLFEERDNEGIRDIGFYDLMIIFSKRKKAIVGFSFLVAAIAVVVTLVLPSTYKATTKLLPPQQAQSGAAALLSQLGGVASAAAGIAGLKNPNDLYIGMLKSRTIADRLIAKFDLKRVYGTDSLEKARRALEYDTVITSGKDGLITIEVESEDKKMVASLTNSYVAELLNLTKTLAVTEAGQRRMFFERQFEQAKDNLANAEMALKSALDKSGVISVDAESKALLETVGRLRAQVSAKEIELSSMRPFLTETNPNYRKVEESLSSMRTELAKLENGRTNTTDIDGGNGSQKGLANIKLLRDVKYYQMLYELLAKQYEIARLDEAKDPSIIQVLDPAVEPERRSKPRRAMIVLISAAAAFVLAMCWVLVSEVRERSLSSKDATVRENN
jgi:tyrosine-protein kinase Etk/Wzc